MHSVAGGDAGANAGKILDRHLPEAVSRMRGLPVDLGVCFLTNHFEEEAAAIAQRICAETSARCLIGCTAEGVIGPVHEHEREPALVFWLAHLPGTQLHPFHFNQSQLEDCTDADDWARLLGTPAMDQPSFLMLGDPYSIDVSAVLDGINRNYPARPIIGGMASGADSPGQSVLLASQSSHREGMVGVALSGGVRIAPVVSQGCRPIGRPFIITKAERNVVLALGGRPPLEVLNEVYAEADERDKQLMREGVFLGRAINEQLPRFQRGDFLVRNVMGADENSGALIIGDLMRVGITVQFHVRDAETANEDLRTLLQPHSPCPGGVLLFSCNGRGTRLFTERDHDLQCVQETLGRPPVAGFFCAGELGPIGGKNFIHGHTASMALFGGEAVRK